MVTADQLARRREAIEQSEDLRRGLDRLGVRVSALLADPAPVPPVKAILTRDGGYCPRDGAALVFDPRSPDRHTCPRCGATQTGPRHQQAWARHQHLWLSERIAELATVAALADDAAAAKGAADLIQRYEEVYFELPNRDNVLGPTRLFFSTYLESIWILNLLAGAALLREADLLDDAAAAAVDRIAEEAANIIGEFNEGLSNRQTWHAAALTAIAAWFGDEDLAGQAVTGRTGLLGHLADGFGEDGSWFEGENYHLFALRGLLTGLTWAQAMGADLLDDTEVREHLRSALLAPARTALPDLTFPARKDSRFGVSLAQPMYLESWEVGRVLAGDEDGRIAGWLRALYAAPVQPAQTFDSWLHESGESPPASRDRASLSWWALLFQEPELPGGTEWSPGSTWLPSQGLAILRRGDRYLSLECGRTGGGHGHPDRLHLTVHADGVYWLPDFGTGSYVTPDLHWYRSTLSHNAPLLDGQDQDWTDAVCEHFEQQEDWGWVQARYQECTRQVVAGPHYIVDVVTLSGTEPRTLVLPWHLLGELEVVNGGTWSPAPMERPFVSQVERLEGGADRSLLVRARHQGRDCQLHLLFEGDLLRMRGPGVPGTGDHLFLACRGEGSVVRMTAVLDFGAGVREITREAEQVTVVHEDTDIHVPLLEGWLVRSAGLEIRLGGAIRQPALTAPLLVRDRVEPPVAQAVWVETAPVLDGTGGGFDRSAPLGMDTELHYRRSEEPWAGPELFSAEAFLNWNEDSLFLLVEVTKQDITLRPAAAEPGLLDNEPDDIHSDGIQVYLERQGEVQGFLVVPELEGSGIRVHRAGNSAADPSRVTGGWAETEHGYRMTLGIRTAFPFDPQEELRFDLLVNEMYPDRRRRAGQLVWSGGNGWVYLQGDRQDPRHFGILELAG